MSLVDLPDQLLTKILAELPTARALCNAMQSTKALQAVVTDECWHTHSAKLRWLWRRRQGGDELESCEAHYRRAVTTSTSLIIVGGDVIAPHSQVAARFPWAVEALDMVSESWLPPPRPARHAAFLPFMQWRSAPSAACDRGIGYVIGGWDEDEDEPMASVATFRVPTLAATFASMAGPSASGEEEDGAQHGTDDDEDEGDASADEDEVEAAAASSASSSISSPRRWKWSYGDRIPNRRAAERQPLLLPDLPEPRCFAAATFDDAGHLWVVGGGDAMTRGASCLDAVVIIDPHADSPVWRPFGGRPMIHKRCGLALASDGNHHSLYLCGGYSGGTTYQETVEVLDMTGVNRGKVLPPMRHGRSGCGAGVGPDGALYVVGGSDNGSNMLGSFERYDPREGTRWQALADLPTPRGYLAACFAPDGSFVASGGCDDGWASAVDAIEAFDPRAGKWRTLPPLPHARSNHVIVNAWSA